MIGTGAGAEDHALGIAPTKMERNSHMLVTAAVDELELLEGWSEADPAIRWRFAPALSAQTGTASSAVMVGKLEPGTRGGMHTHAAEEIPFGEETLTMVNFVPSAILLTTFEDEVAPIGVRTLL